MKKRSVFYALGLSAFMLAGFAFSANNSFVPAHATKGEGDETWYLVGTMNSWNIDDKSLKFEYKKSDDYAAYIYKIDLKAGDAFKISNGTGWEDAGGVVIGYGQNEGSGILKYLENNDGNFKVREAGTYILSVIDDNVAGYDDKSYGFSIVETEWYLSYFEEDVEKVEKRVSLSENEHNPFEYVLKLKEFAANEQWKIHSALGKVWINNYTFSHAEKMSYTMGGNVVVNEAGTYTITMNPYKRNSYVNWNDPFEPGYYLVGTAGINGSAQSSWQKPEYAVAMSELKEEEKVQRVARGVNIPAGAEFGIRHDTLEGATANVEWTNNTLYKNDELIGVDKAFTVKEDSTTNIVCNTAGTYDIYYKVSGYGTGEDGTVWLAVSSLSSTAEQFATKFLADTDAICGLVDQSARLSQLKTAWSKFATDYAALDEAEKTILKDAVANEEGTNIQKAMARYDLICGRYGETNTPNFIGRIIVSGSNSVNIVNASSITMTVIVAASVISLIVLVVFLNKKKFIK